MMFGDASASVIVVIPCLNEAIPIGAVAREVLAAGVDGVIVVDNGSSDDTARRAASSSRNAATAAPVQAD